MIPTNRLFQAADSKMLEFIHAFNARAIPIFLQLQISPYAYYKTFSCESWSGYNHCNGATCEGEPYYPTGYMRIVGYSSPPVNNKVTLGGMLSEAIVTEQSLYIPDPDQPEETNVDFEAYKTPGGYCVATKQGLDAYFFQANTAKPAKEIYDFSVHNPNWKIQ